jgi:starch phosphorylase
VSKLTIISITPELALDEGSAFAGGLGVLEADKFYGASRLGLPYKVLTLFHSGGYVDYDFDVNGNPITKPHSQPPEYLQELVYDGTVVIKLKNEDIRVEIHTYPLGNAEAVFFKPVEPDWATRLANRLYISENDEEKFYTYALLAKAAAEYLQRYVDIAQIDYVDLQEAYACMLPLALRLPGKYRYIIHTPGVWGHPSFAREYFEKEFGYRFISPKVSLTEVGLATSCEAFTVSAKHLEVMSDIVPHFLNKLHFVTNGIDVDRWMDAKLKVLYEAGNLHLDSFMVERSRIRRKFRDFIRRYKDSDVGDRMIAAWCRRIVPYKRPDFVIKAIEELPSKDIFFVLGGKAHPHDGIGLGYMKTFRELHLERENVIYIPDYDISIAKEIHKSVDLILNTPVPGSEACGTSYMKAAVNGVPTLASRNGGVIEFIVNNENGWFFGADVEEFKETWGGTEYDYMEFKRRLTEIASLYRNDEESYYELSLQALTSFLPRVQIERVLGEYYYAISPHTESGTVLSKTSGRASSPHLAV